MKFSKKSVNILSLIDQNKINCPYFKSTYLHIIKMKFEHFAQKNTKITGYTVITNNYNLVDYQHNYMGYMYQVTVP